MGELKYCHSFFCSNNHGHTSMVTLDIITPKASLNFKEIQNNQLTCMMQQLLFGLKF